MKTTNYGGSTRDQIIIAVGANLPSVYGSPLESCMAAFDTLSDMNVNILRQSRWFKTAPIPPSDQPWFINAVAVVDTVLDPESLMNTLHNVEDLFDRQRSGPAAARTMDLDLLDYRGLLRDDASSPELPHPRLESRAFVLLPLADVAPGWIHPRSGVAIAALIDALPADQIAEPME